MENTPVFFDTEFTHFYDSKLISIGLVSACGQELYIELADGWSLAECSIFTLTQVLPFLAHGRFGGTLKDALGARFKILHTQEEMWSEEDLGYYREGCSEELKDWVRELESRAPVRNPTGRALEPDLGALCVKEVPEFVTRLSRMDIGSFLTEGGALLRYQAGASLSGWINALPGTVQLFWDNEKDRELADQLLRHFPARPGKVTFSPIVFPSGIDHSDYQKILDAGKDYLEASGRRHHSLEDARSFRMRWQKARELGVL